jgi:hypothetical protein
MLREKRILAETPHLQLIYGIPESEISLLSQLRPFLRIELSHPVYLEAGDADDRKDHQRRRQLDGPSNPLGHAANIRGRATGNPPLTLINLMPALINVDPS